MKFTATIKVLKKDKLKILHSDDFISQEKVAEKIKHKKKKFKVALQKATQLKEAKLIEFTTKVQTSSLLSLAEIITSFISNTSLTLLDVSHNTLDGQAIKALAELVFKDTLPLNTLFIDYLHNSSTELSGIVKFLIKNKTLERLSLQGNEIKTETCNYLVEWMSTPDIKLQEVDLARCCISLPNLKKLKTVALQHKVTLHLENIGVSDKPSYENIQLLAKSSSLNILSKLSAVPVSSHLNISDSFVDSSTAYELQHLAKIPISIVKSESADNKNENNTNTITNTKN